jgi:putative ABC transport system substrate-binding protein
MNHPGRRLLLVAGLGSMVSLPGFGQTDRVRVIGYITPAAQASLRDEVFRKGLRDLGWAEGRNLRIEYRRGANEVGTLRALADELVRMNVDMIVAQSTPAVHAARDAVAGTAVPLVVISADPLGSGVVSNLRRPGGNITGVSMMMPTLVPKRLELLREVVPKIATVGFLAHGGDPAVPIFTREVEEAGKRLGIRIVVQVSAGPAVLEQAFDSLHKAKAEAIIVQPLWVNTLGLGPQIAELAMRHRMLSIGDGDGFAEQGGLIFYGPDPLAIYGRLATYVDRILRGTKPGEIPVEQPSKFELVVNMKTARALGLKFPQSVLVRADRVIE